MPALETESLAMAALSPVEELDSLGAHKDSMALAGSHNGEAEAEDVGF